MTLPKRGFRYLLATLLILGLTLLAILSTLSTLRKEAIATYQEIASLHARTVEEHFSQTLQQIDHTINRLPYLSNQSPHLETLSPILVELLHNAHYLRSLSIADEKGKIIVSSYMLNVGKTIPLDNFFPVPFGETSILRLGVPWEGRDFFQAQESSHANPIASDALSFIPLVKKSVFNHRTYFVFATLNTDYFANRYTTILAPEQGNIHLWRMDGTLLFSSDAHQNLGAYHYSEIHPKQRGDEDFFEHLKTNRHTAINSFRQARLLPFIVEIDMKEETALATWDKERSHVL